LSGISDSRCRSRVSTSLFGTRSSSVGVCTTSTLSDSVLISPVITRPLFSTSRVTWKSRGTSACGSRTFRRTYSGFARWLPVSSGPILPPAPNSV
jgi:hypothetical protein